MPGCFTGTELVAKCSLLCSMLTLIALQDIGGGKGGARGLRSPLSRPRGGNQNSEMILLEIGLKTSKKDRYTLIECSNTLMLIEVKVVEKCVPKMCLKTKKNFFFSLVGIESWPSVCKANVSIQHQYFPIAIKLYFTAL